MSDVAMNSTRLVIASVKPLRNALTKNSSAQITDTHTRIVWPGMSALTSL